MARFEELNNDSTPTVRDAVNRDDAGYEDDGQRPSGPGDQVDPIQVGSQDAASEDDRIRGVLDMVRGDLQLDNTSDVRRSIEELLTQNGIATSPELLDRLEREVRS